MRLATLRRIVLAPLRGLGRVVLAALALLSTRSRAPEGVTSTSVAVEQQAAEAKAAGDGSDGSAAAAPARLISALTCTFTA